MEVQCQHGAMHHCWHVNSSSSSTTLCSDAQSSLFLGLIQFLLGTHVYQQFLAEKRSLITFWRLIRLVNLCSSSRELLLNFPSSSWALKCSSRASQGTVSKAAHAYAQWHHVSPCICTYKYFNLVRRRVCITSEPPCLQHWARLFSLCISCSSAAQICSSPPSSRTFLVSGAEVVYTTGAWSVVLFGRHFDYYYYF